MLIITKLPFPAPDPISAYEQTLYDDFFDFRDKVIVPEMLIKLKQRDWALNSQYDGYRCYCYIGQSCQYKRSIP